MAVRGAILSLLLSTLALAQGRSATYMARDTLSIQRDASADAQAMLETWAFAPGDFRVTCVAEGGAVTVYFASPVPRGGPFDRGDIVTMEWHVARNDKQEPIEAPAVLVIHTIHPDMPIGRAVARGLATQGFHAFMLQMPGFGERWQPEDDRPDQFLPRMRQAVADARRARDAIAVLPNVQPGPIAIQGTSLGGMIVVIAASLDGAFDPVLLTITGGDIKRIIETGQADAAFVRMRLEQGGIVGDALARACDAIEPTRLAHRLNPQRTWIISAENDVVIPPACTDALAKAIGLPASHRIEVPGNHYTVLTRWPAIVAEMARLLRDSRVKPGDPADPGPASRH